MKRNPTSARHTHILQVITSSAASPLTIAEIAEATGITADSVRIHVKNMRATGKVGAWHPPGTNPQRYAAKAHAAAGPTQRAPNLPQRSTTVLAITKAKPHNQSVSPERLRIEAVLAKASAPMTTIAVSKAADVPPEKARRILQAMRHDGTCTNLEPRSAGQWRAAKSMEAAAQAANARSAQRVCNSTQPTLSRQHLPTMGGTRHGADDHLALPSRRGDLLVGHTPPMLLGSGIGGGMR